MLQAQQPKLMKFQAEAQECREKISDELRKSPVSKEKVLKVVDELIELGNFIY